MPAIMNTQKRVLGCNADVVIFFKPGLNQIQSSDWEKIKNNEALKKKKKNGWLSYAKKFDDKETVEGVVDFESNDDYLLESLGVKDAKEMIKQTLDVKLLMEWQKQETRKTVLSAIDEQIAEMLKSDKKED